MIASFLSMVLCCVCLYLLHLLNSKSENTNTILNQVLSAFRYEFCKVLTLVAPIIVWIVISFWSDTFLTSKIWPSNRFEFHNLIFHFIQSKETLFKVTSCKKLMTLIWFHSLYELTCITLLLNLFPSSIWMSDHDETRCL